LGYDQKVKVCNRCDHPYKYCVCGSGYFEKKPKSLSAKGKVNYPTEKNWKTDPHLALRKEQQALRNEHFST